MATFMASWTVQDDWSIIAAYNSLSREIVNYYTMVDGGLHHSFTKDTLHSKVFSC